eukprot:429120-Pleurochrysis_carterae.AAC.1
MTRGYREGKQSKVGVPLESVCRTSEEIESGVGRVCGEGEGEGAGGGEVGRERWRCEIGREGEGESESERERGRQGERERPPSLAANGVKCRCKSSGRESEDEGDVVGVRVQRHGVSILPERSRSVSESVRGRQKEATTGLQRFGVHYLRNIVEGTTGDDVRLRKSWLLCMLGS